MKLRVKICGIRDPEDAQMCSAAGADALGFIFYPESPRYVDPDAAAAIIRELPPFITPVGVFVNAERKVIQSIISRTGIRAIQLSGDESPSDCQGYTVSVVKAFRIKHLDEVERVKEYTISAAMLDGASGGPGIRPDGEEPPGAKGGGASVYGGFGAIAAVRGAGSLQHVHP